MPGSNLAIKTLSGRFLPLLSLRNFLDVYNFLKSIFCYSCLFVIFNPFLCSFLPSPSFLLIPQASDSGQGSTKQAVLCSAYFCLSWTFSITQHSVRPVALLFTAFCFLLFFSYFQYKSRGSFSCLRLLAFQDIFVCFIFNDVIHSSEFFGHSIYQI